MSHHTDSVTMAQLNSDYPSNHAPTYNDQPMHPLLAAINGNMEKYANLGNSARYHNHMLSLAQPVEDDDTPIQRAYPNSGAGATGWGGAPTGTGGGGTGHSGYGYEHPSGGTGGGGGGGYGGGYGGVYDYHPAAPVHIPTGGSYAPYAAAGSGYGAPVHPPKYYQPHPPAPPAYPTKGIFNKKKYSKKDSNASTINALTLLAFFFFVNLLQNCLKDNMEAMNPTVMVMTKNMVRNRNSKLAEMNSREHSTSPASTFTSGANIVVQPEDLVSAAAGAAGSTIGAVAPAGGSVLLQTSPYSDGGGESSVGASNTVNVGNNFAGGASVISNNNNQNQHNNNYNNNNQVGRPPEPQYSYGSGGITPNQLHTSNVPSLGSQHNINTNNNNNHAYGANPHFGQVPFSVTSTPAIISPHQPPQPDFHDAPYPYPNQTLITATNAPLGHQYYQGHVQQQHPYNPEHFEQESYEPQIHRPQPKPQIQQQQQQHQQSYETNHFQQHHGQHYHHSHTTDHQSDHRDHYQDEQEQPPQDHFQHHYPIEHHSQQGSHYPIDRRPLRPTDDQSVPSNPWSYNPASSSLNTNKRGSNHSPLSSYTWSSGTLPSRVSGNNNFNDRDEEDNDRYEDTFYTRSNRRSYIDKL